MRTAIYTWVSTRAARQYAEGQLRQLRAFAEAQGWTVVHEYVDRVSVKQGVREQFQKMFAAASRREFDCCLFWSLDRLSREGAAGTLSHLEVLTSYGLSYRSLTEPYLVSTGMHKEAVVGIVGASLERARARGHSGGRPKVEDREPNLVAIVVRLRSKGSSIRAIAAEVKKSPNTVLRLLRSGDGVK